MVKQRFSTADLAAEVGSLRSKLHGMRVTNVFDISSKVYAFKLARGQETGEKAILLIESGMRMHTVDELPEKPNTPSNFVLKLRKHVRSRRLEDIRQLGSDRVCQMTFGSGEHEVKILLEFFASGNIVMVDPRYSVLSLLRSHRDDAKGLATMSQHSYPIQAIKLRKATDAEDFQERLRLSLSDPTGKTTLKDAVAKCLAYGPHVAAFCIRRAGLDPKRKGPLCRGENGDDQDFVSLLHQVWEFEKWVDSCEDQSPAGCISVDTNGQYHDFQPLVNGSPIVEPAAGMRRLDFGTFDEAVREFFSKIHGDRAANQMQQQENAAQKKLQAIREDHAMRIKNLNKEVVVAERKASVLQYNLEKADAAMDSVREALAAGFSWDGLWEMIQEEKQNGNPVAMLIHSMRLEKNSISLLLDDVGADDMEGHDSLGGDEQVVGGRSGTSGKTVVEVDLGLSSAHANVEAYYDLKKKQADKARRTLESNDKALAAAEKNVLIKLKKIQEAKLEQAAGGKARTERKPYWFEKFHWFISSENYLIVSGRDAQQNDLLVRRYLKKGDAYVHAELHGASSTIVKNNDPSSPIPYMTLCEAGQACVARSSAWDAKVTAAAYWVNPDQVSKTAPSGEYLTTGSMMIRGKKNYLPMSQLVMGIGWLFKLEEGSVAGHLGERRVRAIGGSDQSSATQLAPEAGNCGASSSSSVKTALERFLEGSAVEEYSITTTATTKPRKKSTKAGGKAVNTGKEASRTKDSLDAKPETKEVSMRTIKKKQKKQSKYQDQDDEERELAKAFLGSGGEKKNRDRKARKELRKAKMTARKMAASGLTPAEVTEEGIAELTQRLGEVVDVGDTANGSEDDELLRGSGENKPPAPHDVDERDRNATEGVHEYTGTSSRDGIDDSIEDGTLHQAGATNRARQDEGAEGQGQDQVQPYGHEEEQEDEFANEGGTNVLDQLTGLPKPGDELLAALPVIAPYTTLASYKYSIKLLPGTQKKGKAYKQAMELIKAKFKGSSRELSLMEAISLEEGINAMLGSVTLQSAGMQKIRQQQKDRKKANKALKK